MTGQHDDTHATSDSSHDLFGPPTLTLDEVARLYGVPPLIIRKALERGELAATSAKDGQDLLSRAAVLEWLKRRRDGWA
jgi:excisionase family DNA binding protein